MPPGKLPDMLEPHMIGFMARELDLHLDACVALEGRQRFIEARGEMTEPGIFAWACERMRFRAVCKRN